MKRTNGIIEQINVATRATDPWEGISADVIRRFVDVLCAQHALPKEVLMAYHADLESLDRWLIETKQRTLVCAPVAVVRLSSHARRTVRVPPVFSHPCWMQSFVTDAVSPMRWRWGAAIVAPYGLAQPPERAAAADTGVSFERRSVKQLSTWAR